MSLISGLRDVLLAIFIAILIPTTLYYGYEALYPQPAWPLVAINPEGQALENKIHETKNEINRLDDIITKLESIPASDVTAKRQLSTNTQKIAALKKTLEQLNVELKPHEDEHTKRRQIVAEDMRHKFDMRNMIIFYMSLIVSVLLMITALYVPTVFVSVAFVLGGILTAIYGFVMHGYQIGSIVRFAILLASLITLVYVSLRFAKEHKN
jgi:hypothetical protein